MNKNPARPKEIDDIMSSVFNPNYKKKKKGKYWEVQEELKRRFKE